MQYVNSPTKLTSFALLCASLFGCSPGKTPDAPHASSPDSSQLASSSLFSNWNAEASNIAARYPHFPGLTSIALEQRKREVLKAPISRQEAEAFSTKLLESWREDLAGLGVHPPHFSHLETEQNALTFHSLRHGVFALGGVMQSKDMAGEWYGRVGLARVRPVAFDHDQGTRIGLGALAPNSVEFYALETPDIQPRITFLAFTSVGIETNAYKIVINLTGIHHMVTSLLKPVSSDEQATLEQALLDVAKLNELSTAILGNKLRCKDPAFAIHDQSLISLHVIPSKQVSVNEIFEAFSDLCSWKHGTLPAWSHLILLANQLSMQSPQSYGFTFHLQTEAVTTSFQHNAQLAESLKSFAEEKGYRELDLIQISEFLRSNTEFDQVFKSTVIAQLDQQVTPEINRFLARPNVTK